MKAIHTETILFKTLNVVVLYALALNILLPAVNAYGQITTFDRERGIPHSFHSQPLFFGTEQAVEQSEEIAQSPEFAVQPVKEVHETGLRELKIPEAEQSVTLAMPNDGQPESSGFSLGSMSGLVDEFTGDFAYSIPLMDVEGYPITISYNSNIGMNDEASWVGLGWNLNVGSVSREMRGIPDEFDGSQAVSRTYNLLQDNTTDGVKAGVVGGVSYRIAGTKVMKLGLDLSLLWGSYDNPYVGKAETFDFGFAARYSIGTKNNLYFGPNFAFGYSRDTKGGIGSSSSIGLQAGYMDEKNGGPAGNLGLSWGAGTHSRYGVNQRKLNLSAGGGYIGPKSGAIAGGSFGSTFTCGSLTAIPRLELGSTYTNDHTIIDAYVGFKPFRLANLYTTIGGELQLYDATQQFEFSDYGDQIIYTAAFGYLHSEKRNHYTGGNAVMDFNRERGQEFSEEMKNLPFSFPTYDVFYANGAGLGATFRGQRSDVGVYHDDLITASQDGKSREFGAGFIIAGGFSIELGYSEGNTDVDTKTGKWETSSATEVFQFGSDELVYFKGIGEQTPHSANLLNVTYGIEPAALVIDKTNQSIIKTDELMSKSGATTTVSAAALNALNGEEIIANIYEPRTAAEMGTEDFLSYELNDFISPTITSLDRISGARASNHFSAIEITTTDGMHYKYGVPSYTLLQSEVSFANEGYSVDGDGLATYTAGTDNSISNTKGRTHFYDKTNVPAYAHSFLLTEITGSDYVDRLNDGPTLDDIGSWYNFTYTRLYDAADPFKTRFPMAEDKALIDQGLLGTVTDDISSYSYSEKEIWYAHSVESKNFVAEFVLEDRLDAFGVVDENGELEDGKPLKKLAKIRLYNRSDRVLFGAGAKPIQTVEFEYDYSLCPDNPANSVPGDGKLTLKAIRVYSGDVSQETALAPYVFEYSDINPPHNYADVDRWGNYKPDDVAKPNALFPYAEQDISTATDNIQAWKLVKIISPMTAELEITYGADSYGYVQNRRAMEHLEIAGYTSAYELAYLSELTEFDGTSHVSGELKKDLDLGSDIAAMADDIDPGWSAGLSGVLSSITNAYNTNSLSLVSNDLLLFNQLNHTPANVVVFKLNDAITAGSVAEASEIFRNQYLNTRTNETDPPAYLKEVYLKNRVNVEDGIENYEIVPTMAKIDVDEVDFSAYFPFGAIPPTGVLPPNSGGSYEYGYIVLQNVPSTDEKGAILMSPVQKTALEFVRLHLPDKVYGACDGCTPDLHVDRKVFWGGDLYKIMSDYYCMEVNPELSSVRCFDHNNYKIGGNAKVTKLVFKDNWDAISTEYDSEYEWHYKTSTDDNRPWTYGVASYEPRVGIDENPFYNWNRYTNKSVSFPDETQFSIDPTGESLFPDAIIGYHTSELTMGGNRVTPTNGIGSSVSKFMTAFDKPTICNSTALQRKNAHHNNVLYKEVDLFGFSQGHVVITNDFHGKPSENEVFDNNGNSQYKTVYHYKQLLEIVPMLDREGVIHEENTAMEYDIYADSRFSKSKAKVLTFGGVINIPIFPFGLPLLFPNIGYSERLSGFFTHTLNKHINYSAVIDSITTTSLGSQNMAVNLVYDRYSGAVLLSSLKDEYNDQLYSLSYPSHWYHEDFQSPLLQPQNTLSGTINLGLFTYSNYLGDYFSVGDEVSIVVGASPAVTGNVLDIIGSTMHLILGSTGAAITSTTNQACTVTLEKSNRKNRLMETMQQVVTKRNPLSGTPLVMTFPTEDIIDASAISYKRRYNVLCSPSEERRPPNSTEPGATINPFRFGIMNDLMMEHSYIPQVERSSVELQGIRFNGKLVDNGPTDFIMFYEYNTSTDRWFRVHESGHPRYSGGDPLRKWNPSGQTATYDEYGKVLDAFDRINVFSAVQYGYNRLHKLVPVAQAVNARQHEIGFDSFEDYVYHGPPSYAGDIGHFDFMESYINNIGDVDLVVTEKHSGLISLKVMADEFAEVFRPITGEEEACDAVIETFTGTNHFEVTECNCTKPFAPTPGKYIISAWVKGNLLSSAAEYTDAYVYVSFPGSMVTPYTIRPTGQLIDGWQRMEAEIDIPDEDVISIRLVNDNSENPVYFDDIRIHPFLAGMTTTVYNFSNLLPMASHDGYNFTTFYNYDENLNQVSIRVETIDGIKTIVTSEGSTVKTYK